MNRLLYAVPLCGLLLCTGRASADYLLIKVNVNQVGQFAANPAGGLGAQGGAGMVGGSPPGGDVPGGGMVGGDAGAGFMGGAGIMGGAPGMAPGGQPGQPGAAKPAEDPNAVWLSVFVEPAKLKMVSQHFAQLDHQWGKKTFLPTFAPTMFQFAQLQQTPFRTKFAKDFNDLSYKIKKDKGGKDKQKHVDTLRYLAGWAFSHGQLKQFHQAMEQIGKLDAKNPLFQNYEKLQKALAQPFGEDDPLQRAYLDELKADGYRPVVSDKGHYVLWTKLTSTTANDAEVRARLGLMEETLENFYYWFLFQDNLAVPPLPKHRLAAVLTETVQEFHNRNVAWGSVPMAADGFTARRPNVMILAPKRQDEPYQLLDKAMPDLLRLAGYSPDTLLSGKVWDDRMAMAKGHIVPIVQTLVLVDKAASEEGERATVTHEGVRQLLVASGLFPRNVGVPDWVLTGLAGYFETPVSAVYPGVGLPNWSHLISFKYFHGKKKFSDSAEVLYDVVTDRYFQRARQSSEEAQEKKDDEKLQQRAKEDWELARCTSWALVYYLAQKGKLNLLFRYGEELNKLPRDLDLDERALRACFARAFDLGDVKDAQQLNHNRLRAFANAWISEVQNVVLEVQEVESISLRERVNQAQPKKTPPPANPQNVPPGMIPPGGT